MQLETPCQKGFQNHLLIEPARYRFDFEQIIGHWFRSTCERHDSAIDRFWRRAEAALQCGSKNVDRNPVSVAAAAGWRG
jgi:hypothetical protein